MEAGKDMADKRTSFHDMTLGAFREALASRQAVPGGGGAAALAGSLAASLLVMVGNLTVGKKKYAANEEEIKALMEQAEASAEKLLSLVDADAAAFRPLSEAYSLPAATEEEVRIRDEVMEQCLRDAAAVPLAICEEVNRVIPLLAALREKGSVLAVSDVGCAAALAEAALKSAALNVYVNTRLMKDRTYAEDLNGKCSDLTEKGRTASTVCSLVERQLKKTPNTQKKPAGGR